MPDSHEVALMHDISSYEDFIRDLQSLRPVWVGVNDDDDDTDAKIKTLIKKYEAYKSDSDRELYG
tara:strand:- start:446 stop:640 length:195 start_codon:yes stop_codon:yes gene_type:complete